MKALILIGGMGTRLRPLTCTTPKPLLPIVNRPFLEYQFQLLKKYGVKEVVLCVAYLSHEFEKYFGSGKKWGLKIRYVHEKNPLGTGGAIRNAIDFIDEPTIVFNGDILTDIDLKSMYAYHAQKKAIVTIGLTRVKDPTIYGLVETGRDGRVERFLEKPSWDEVTCNTINAGVYIFDPEAVKLIPSGVNYSVERGLFPSLLHEGLGLYGYTFKGYWLDIGSIDKYLQAHYDLMARSVDLPLPGHMRQDNLWVGKNFKIGKHVELNGKLVCGDNVSIGDYAQIKGNVSLGSGVKVGQGSQICDSVVLEGARIDEGNRLERVLIGKDCVIESNCTLGMFTTLGNGTIIRKYSKL